MDVKGRKAEQSESTRNALLSAARELFGARGYAGTPTEEIVQRAGVTRGALYHHFRDKADLFRAVFEELQQEMTQRVAKRSVAARGGLWPQIRAGFAAFLDACLEPEMRQIALLDAPSVLGWPGYREIESRYGLQLIAASLTNAMDAGILERQPVEPLAHLLLSVLHEAGMLIANASDVAKARREVGQTVDRLLEGLKA